MNLFTVDHLERQSMCCNLVYAASAPNPPGFVLTHRLRYRDYVQRLPRAPKLFRLYLPPPFPPEGGFHIHIGHLSRNDDTYMYKALWTCIAYRQETVLWATVHAESILYYRLLHYYCETLCQRGICCVMCLSSVCLSVCHTQTGIVSKPLNLGSRKQHRTTDKWI